MSCDLCDQLHIVASLTEPSPRSRNSLLDLLIPLFAESIASAAALKRRLR